MENVLWLDLNDVDDRLCIKIYNNSDCVNNNHPYLSKYELYGDEYPFKLIQIAVLSTMIDIKLLNGVCCNDNEDFVVIPYVNILDFSICSIRLVNQNLQEVVIDCRKNKEDCCVMISKIIDDQHNDLIFLSTDIQSGFVASEAFGSVCIVPISAKTLSLVSSFVHKKYKESYVVVLGELMSDGDVDQSCFEVAKLANGVVAIPDFGKKRDLSESNFWDLSRRLDLNRPVWRCVEEAIAIFQEKKLTVSEKMLKDYGLIMTCAADIEPEPINWLWPGWLAMSKVHIVAGMPGTSKTTVLLDFAAIISSGGRFPDGAQATPGKIVIWSGEDGSADTIIPRLHAAGADVSQIYILSGVKDGSGARSFDPATDFNTLDKAVSYLGTVSLVIIDPIVSAVAGDSHKNTEVRRGLQIIVDFAIKHSCAVIGITHFSKGGQGKNVVERFTGSIAYTALPRVSMVVVKCENDTQNARMLIRAKSNIGPDGGGFKFNIDYRELPGNSKIIPPYVVWGDFVDLNAQEIMDSVDNPKSSTETDKAIDFLYDILRLGPVRVVEVQQAAEELGFSWPTVRRAQSKIGVKSRKGKKQEGGQFFWSLPEDIIVESSGEGFPTSFDGEIILNQ